MVPLYELYGSHNSGVSVHRGIMMSGDHCPGARPYISDYSPAVLVPYSIHFLQLMSINPLE
jgi:hypothetical protein